MKSIYHLKTVVRRPVKWADANHFTLNFFGPFLLQGKKGRKEGKRK